MKVDVLLLSGTIFTVKIKSKEATGKVLLSRVFQHVSLFGDGSFYFGLCYPDKDDGGMNWVEIDDNLKEYAHRVASFQFSVRFFPRHPDLVFTDAVARRLFRQHMKGMLLNCQLGCETKMHALLDSYIVQAELGDSCPETDVSYLRRASRVEIYAPTCLSAGTPILENEYIKLVRNFHKRHAGLSPTQADIQYLCCVQKLPLYGLRLHKVRDKSHRDFFVALCETGLKLIYEDLNDKFTLPTQCKVYQWNQLVFCERDHNRIKFGLFVGNNFDLVEYSLKVPQRFSQRGAERLVKDLHAYKKFFLSEVDGQQLFDSRKEAHRCYTDQIPRRNPMANKKFQSLRSSVRNTLTRVSLKKKVPLEEKHDAGNETQFSMLPYE